MSKDPGEIGSNIAGELVGITRISQLLFKEMCADAETLFERTLQVDYETDCLSTVSTRFPLYYCLVTDLTWSEIDTPSDFRRTQDMVYPEIIKQAQTGDNIGYSSLNNQPMLPNSGYTFESGGSNDV
jgi:2-aminoethylphosphonate-pyruvate transaminase